MVNYPWTESTQERLRQQLEQNRIPHALLLAGAPGLGKEALAQQLAAALLCLRPEQGRACGGCRSCDLLLGGAHPDRFWLSPEEGKTQLQVDPVRELLGRLVLTTTISPRKVAVLYPAEAMNSNAANALLKNLEEPPGDTVILLVSHDISRLPITIRSRCQRLQVHAPDPEAVARWLMAQSGQGREQVELALQASGAGPREALALLEAGDLERYTTLQRQLGQLIAKPAQAGPMAAEWADAEPQQLWRWLSLNSALLLRRLLAGAQPSWVRTERELPPSKLAALQQKADRNRSRLGSGLRKDLLLQEWLLEWARLPSSEPIR